MCFMVYSKLPKSLKDLFGNCFFRKLKKCLYSLNEYLYLLRLSQGQVKAIKLMGHEATAKPGSALSAINQTHELSTVNRIKANKKCSTNLIPSTVWTDTNGPNTRIYLSTRVNFINEPRPLLWSRPRAAGYRGIRGRPLGQPRPNRD